MMPLTTLCLIVFGAWLGLEWAFVRRARRNRCRLGQLPRTIQTVIVLGAPARPSVTPLLAERLRFALEAAQQLRTTIVVSGNGLSSACNEVEPMRDWLMLRNRGQVVIDVFEGAERTIDSVVDAARWPGPVLLVTSDFHIDRALFLAQSLGVHAYGLGTPTPVTAQRRAKIFVRERLSRVRAIFDVFIWRPR